MMPFTRMNTRKFFIKYINKNGQSNTKESLVMLPNTLQKSNFWPWNSNIKSLKNTNSNKEMMSTLTSSSTSKKPKTLSKREWTFPLTSHYATNYTTSSENFKYGSQLQSFSNTIKRQIIQEVLNHYFSELQNNYFKSIS